MAESISDGKCPEPWWQSRYGNYPDSYMAATWFYQVSPGKTVIGDNYGPYWK